MTTHNEEVARVKALREAFIKGALFRDALTSDGELHPTYPVAWNAAAAKRYPMPTVEVPRVVPDPSLEDYEWKLSGECIYRREKKGPWLMVSDCAITRDRVKLWADLIANPTERRQVDE